MLEVAPEMLASVPPPTRIHWYVYPGVARPSLSMMPDVAAVSVCPTCAVPVIVGAPVAGLFGVRNWTVTVLPAQS